MSDICVLPILQLRLRYAQDERSGKIRASFFPEPREVYAFACC